MKHALFAILALALAFSLVFGCESETSIVDVYHEKEQAVIEADPEWNAAITKVMESSYYPYHMPDGLKVSVTIIRDPVDPLVGYNPSDCFLWKKADVVAFAEKVDHLPAVAEFSMSRFSQPLFVNEIRYDGMVFRAADPMDMEYDKTLDGFWIWCVPAPLDYPANTRRCVFFPKGKFSVEKVAYR